MTKKPILPPPSLPLPLRRVSGGFDRGKYTVVRDTREQRGSGWSFSETALCEGTVRATLKTGDYTLLGYESVLCIERKGSVGEFARNICQQRFWNEMGRLKAFPMPVLLLEFTLHDVEMWPFGSKIPRSRWGRVRVTSKFIISSIKRIEEEFAPIRVILAGADGKKIAQEIFSEVRHRHEV